MPTTPPPSFSPWHWLLTGAFGVSLIAFFLSLQAVEPPSMYLHSQSTDPTPQEFSFYRDLPTLEVPVSAVPNSAVKSEKSDVIYLLQVASFKSLQEAKDTRIKLIHLNLPAHVEAANIGTGQVWNRVIVGPFESRSKLQKARNILISNRYEAMLVQRKPNIKP